ncbi:MAG: WD40/YVTN/BNR-like repeat-containing protein, partial [Akkermansiaceae bacterium]
MKFIQSALLIAASLLLPVNLSHAALGDHWQRVRTGPVNYYVSDAIWTGSEFFAVGTGVYRSSDGTHWEQQIALDHKNLTGIAYSGSMLVAVGLDGSILYSSDGSHWKNSTYSSSSDFRAVTWAGNQFIAVGVNGHLAKSSDGINWASHSFPFSMPTINDVIWANGLIVAVGAGSNIAVSTDGQDWVKTNLEGDSQTAIWNGSQFVIIGNKTVHSSPDGLTWQRHEISAEHNYGGVLEAIDWDGSKYTMTNSNGYVFTSTDGMNWSTGHARRIGGLVKLLYINGKHYGFWSRQNSIISSSNGINWEVIH